MGYVKIETDQYPQAILRHILDTSNFQKRRIFFLQNLPPRTAKTVFENPKGGAFGSEKTVFAVQGGNLKKKKILCFWKSLKYV